ncbi:MAG: hypothetical protein AB1424_00650 [Thermodesulfobacteriota bacterium]
MSAPFQNEPLRDFADPKRTTACIPEGVINFLPGTCTSTAKSPAPGVGAQPGGGFKMPGANPQAGGPD